MKIYKAAIIGLGPSGLAVNKILYGDSYNEIIAFDIFTSFSELNSLRLFKFFRDILGIQFAGKYILFIFESSWTSRAIFVSCIPIPRSIADFAASLFFTPIIFDIINPTVPATW